MPDNGIDFEGSVAQGAAANANGNNQQQEDKTPLDGGQNNDITGKDGNKPDGNNANQNNSGDDNGNQGGNNNDGNLSTGELQPGTEIQYGDDIYTVSDNGDLVDKDGKVFKEAKDVDAWLKENNATDTDDNDALSIGAIKEAVGLSVLDKDGNEIEFTNDAAGVKSYIDNVIALQARDIQQGAINKLYEDNPLLKQFIDYVQLNGSPRGFGEIPDRRGIKLDKDNQNQLEAVIRMAAQEFGNKSLNDSYIKYLKESGALYDEAKTQLAALVEKDNAYRKELELKAQAAREEEERSVAEYWKDIANIISNRVISGYKLPETFVKEVNGQKITVTPADFYRYISVTKQDANGNSMTDYQRDLQNLTPEEHVNKDLLNAWLTFTGGSYKDLIDMAVKEDKVRRLVIKSKENRNTRTVKVVKANQGKVNPEDIVLS